MTDRDRNLSEDGMGYLGDDGLMHLEPEPPEKPKPKRKRPKPHKQSDAPACD